MFWFWFYIEIQDRVNRMKISYEAVEKILWILIPIHKRGTIGATEANPGQVRFNRGGCSGVDLKHIFVLDQIKDTSAWKPFRL